MKNQPEISCDEIALQLESLRRGDASAEFTALADHHLARCPACRRQLAHLKRLTRMMSAWRPLRVPSMVKIETAAMVSAELGELAAQCLPQEKVGRFPRPAWRRLPPLKSWQAVVNAAALAALVFAALAIVVHVVGKRHPSGLSAADAALGDVDDSGAARGRDGAGDAGAGGAGAGVGGTGQKELFDVLLIHPGLADEARLQQVLREATGLAPSSVREMVRQALRGEAVVVRGGVSRADGAATVERLKSAGAEAEMRPR